MLDAYTGDLLAAAEEALHAPTYLSFRELGEWHSHVLRNRLPLIREALRIVREEGDAELASQLIDQAVRDHPAPAGPRAPIPRPALTLVSADDELPVPERVLCALLHRHWAMTVEGHAPHERFVAYRPFNWAGEGDRFERITAPTRTELLRLLAHRHLGIERVDPDHGPDPGPSDSA